MMKTVHDRHICLQQGSGLVLVALLLESLLTPPCLPAHAWFQPLGYTPPAAGIYKLPVVQRATDGDVLDTAGATRRLFDYMDNTIVLLSCIYTGCNDAGGCLLAMLFCDMVRISRR
jgi:hypothetical protein